jgi:hypothetical protein
MLRADLRAGVCFGDASLSHSCDSRVLELLAKNFDCKLHIVHVAIFSNSKHRLRTQKTSIIEKGEDLNGQYES